MDMDIVDIMDMGIIEQKTKKPGLASQGRLQPLQ